MASSTSLDLEGSESQPIEIKPEGEDAVDVPASFRGKLNLSSFAFSTPSTTASPASSPSKPRGRPNKNHQDQDPVSSTTFPSVSPAPNKRKSSTISSTPSSTSPSKRSRTPKSYAPPATYAHLPELPDTIAPNLILLLIGLNPGIKTATSGNPYAHPSNLFWKLLFSSGITPRLYLPSEHKKLPGELSLGNTNIVARPTRNGAELSKGEMDDAVAELERKIGETKPEAVCLVGKGIWESVWRVRHGKALKKNEFKYGWQDSEKMGVVKAKEGVEGWGGARIFVATSTSGLAASMSMAEKEAVWKELGNWVKERRSQRALVAGAPIGAS